MGEIRHITLRKRIEIDGQERDRLTVRNRKRGTQRRLVPDRQEHVNFSRRELTIVFLVAFDVRCLDIVEGKIPAFLIAKFGHALEEIFIMWGLSGLHTDKADAQHLVLLGLRRKRPRRRAAEERDELAPFQLIELHSILASQGRVAGYRIASDQSAGMLEFCNQSWFCLRWRATVRYTFGTMNAQIERCSRPSPRHTWQWGS